MKNIKASLYGYIIGDAIGLPLKNKKRNTLLKNPVNDMLPIDKMNNEIGYWSLNSSFVLATIDSIVENDRKINYTDIMRKYIECTTNSKYLSHEKFKKELNKNITYAINRFNNNITPTECGSKKYEDNDNKSLSRMLPIVLYCYYKNVDNEEDIFSLVKKYSSLTHSHQLSIMACFIYVRYLLYILRGKDKTTAYNLIKYTDYNKYFRKEIIQEYSRILNSNIFELNINEIQSKSNVVDTLETTIWIIINTNSYQQAIVGAINLGGDTNTLAGIVGGIAGVLYGYESIPSKWINNIKKKELINSIILNLVMQLY